MARIKLQLPEKFVFETTIKVQIGDINYGGHMSNDAYLKLAHEARIRFLETQGWSEKDVDGYALIMSDAGIQFQNEVFRGDELSIKIAMEDITKRGFDLYYVLHNLEKDTPVAKIKTGMLFFDYSNHKLAVIPEATIEQLKGLSK
jgi:acyl-CoA thioester hydrolase